MAVRNWADIDYYAVLGVRRDASDDEIARAFRTLVKSLHPDLADAPPEEAARFHQVVDAYEVLSDPAQRRDYDDVLAIRDETPPGVTRRPGSHMSVPKPPPAPLIRWTVRKAWGAIVGGIACLVLAVIVGTYTISLNVRDTDERSGRIETRATVVERAGTTPGLEFAAGGQQVVTDIPERFGGGGALTPDETVTILYRATRPSDVIVDESHFGRNFMFWFVAAKLLVCGPIIFLVGRRRLRTLRASKELLLV